MFIISGSGTYIYIYIYKIIYIYILYFYKSYIYIEYIFIKSLRLPVRVIHILIYTVTVTNYENRKLQLLLLTENYHIISFIPYSI